MSSADNLLYVSAQDHSALSSLGVQKKVRGQLLALKNIGINVKLVCFEGIRIVLDGEILESPKEIHSRRKKLFSAINDHLDETVYQIIYIRHPKTTVSFILFLRAISRAQPNARIVIEIPTYPYYGQARAFREYVLFTLDILLSPLLKLYVHKIVTFYGQTTIFSIPAISIGNGINLEDNKIVRRIPNIEKSNTLRIIGVANVRDYHGFDRVILGLSKYSGEKTFVFDVVGGGVEIKRLKKLVDVCKLNTVVKFHGVLDGADLDRVYATSDIAISTLCMHRRRLKNDSSLKTREYCARGIPFVMCTPDYDFPSDFPYALKVQSNDDPLDISELVRFVDELCEMSIVQKEMHDFAARYLTWDVKMPKVIEGIHESTH